ncbi:MAG: penicillin-binding transpeptidase domain-containing protein [Candidatus Paceibacterota bacterium]
MITRILKRNSKYKNFFVYPDEIFLDSQNLQNFDRQQFEGRIEKPIPKRTILFLGVFFLLITLVFGARLIYLQIKNGDSFRKRSENNILAKVNIFTERGIIYDRNNVELAWNKKADETSDLYTRSYLSPGFSHVLGYVGYPAKDATGNYWQSEFIGKDGLEKQYSELIKGVNGSKIIETNAVGEVNSENVINAPVRGTDLVTTIDSRLQMQLFNLIQHAAENFNFSGGAGVIVNAQNGEILASTSYPEYNSEVLSLGKDKAAISGYLSDKRKVFVDRTISGLYTPGSIVKPFFALGALAENIIDPYKKILSTGSISIPNPYFPDQKTVFKDWRANGWTDMREALAVSSDVYFYSIGGGYADQKGLGISNIEKYSKIFGIGEKTGVDLPDETQGIIPSPEWKVKNFSGDAWRIGDTYHTAIGQYGFQVTPMEMARAAASIANGGTLITPHYILGDKKKEEQTSKIDIPNTYFTIIKEGMRMAVTSGTASALNVPYVHIAVKTGTAQLGANKDRVNSWVMGFFPAENPKYAFTLMMESGPKTNSVSASTISRQFFDWMSTNSPEYFN